ncbi:hypothetical protein GYMLUDRAFT_36732, partial [Collybiopsis luxurians FD-317 M1]
MEGSHPLKALLNLHLASDNSAVIHLPYVLDTLSAHHFIPSPHLTKWTSRLNSLLHSKEAGARWAGLCLAHRTSVCSKSIMLECAQSWLGVAIPILSKKECLPVLKAAINLSRIVFSNATDKPEFQRQISTPNVPKFTAALIAFLEKDAEHELKKLSLLTLTRLVPLYPNIHRASHPALSAVVSQIFAQSSPTHTSLELVELASQLYAVLHFTGGKVGAANLWRKSLDESIGSAWTAFTGVRTTFPDEKGRSSQAQPLHEDPVTSGILSIERLCTSIRVICSLLQSPAQRPVLVPVGSLVNLASKMILVTADEEAPASVDPVVWAMETSVIPRIWAESCRLIICLVECLGLHLTPYSSRLLSYIAFHLETELSSSQQISFLNTAHVLLTHCHPSNSPALYSRLTKIMISDMTVILPSQSDVQNSLAETNALGKSKKGKKRTRTYEGDELFRTSADVVCPTADDAKALLIACDILRTLLRGSDLPPALHSLASRVILALFLGLPQMMPARLSPYPYVYDALLCKIREAAIELGSGTTSTMSKSLNLIIGAVLNTNIDQDSLRKVDLLIHPRLPPLLRPLPKLDALTLFRAEESAEEAEARHSLGIDAAANASVASRDVVMKEAKTTSDTPFVASPSQKPSIPPIMQTAPREHFSSGLTYVPSVGSSVTPVVPQITSIVPQQPLEPGLISTVAVKPTIPPSYASQTIGQSEAVNTMVPAPLEGLDDDEEMPSINLESDSESD